MERNLEAFAIDVHASGKKELKKVKKLFRELDIPYRKMKDENDKYKNAKHFAYGNGSCRFEMYNYRHIIICGNPEILTLPDDWDKLYKYLGLTIKKELTVNDMVEGEVYCFKLDDIDYLIRFECMGGCDDIRYHSFLNLHKDYKTFILNSSCGGSGVIVKASPEQEQQLIKKERENRLEWNQDKKHFDNYIESFPVFMKDKGSDLIIMFSDYTTGTVIKTSNKRSLGFSYNCYISCECSNHWQPVKELKAETF